MGEEILFTFRTIFWPVIIWPYYDKSHTIQIIGWESMRPHTLRNVKMSFAGTLSFTKKQMKVNHVILGRWLSITIQNKDIESIHPYDKDNDLLEVIFHQADMCKLMKFFIRGAPENRRLLNLQGNHGKLLEKTKEEITT